MGNYTIFFKFENPRRGRQARNFSENDTKFLDLKSSSEQIILRKLSLGAPAKTKRNILKRLKLANNWIFYQILSLPGKFELNEANVFILKGVLEKIVINLHSPVLNTMR